MQIINLLGLILILMSCKTMSLESDLQSQTNGDVFASLRPQARSSEGETAPKMCVALRGNAERLLAHTTVMADLISDFGMIGAGAGGSSSSISLFLYESAYVNPAVWDCSDMNTGKKRRCSDREASYRVSLLLKSMQGYLSTAKFHPNIVQVVAMIPTFKAVSPETIDNLTSEQITSLENFIASDTVASISNDEELYTYVFGLDPFTNEKVKLGPFGEVFYYHNGESQSFAYSEIEEQLKIDTYFKMNDKRMFFRPGLVSFKKLAKIIGGIGDFYAGYGTSYNHGAMKTFLDHCDNEVTRKQPWAGIAEKPGIFGVSGSTECGNYFRNLVFSHWKTPEDGPGKHRIDEPVGKYLPSLVSTSVLQGEQAFKMYLNGSRIYYNGNGGKDKVVADLDKAFNPDFERDLKIGYWGAPQDVNPLTVKLHQRSDYKSKKYLALPQATWLQAISTSIGEPSIARVQPLSKENKLISAGGWPDLAPTIILKEYGCENVVYITRRGGESKFAQTAAGLLGMTPQQKTALYDLDNNSIESSFEVSLDVADGVVCTDWDNANIAITDMKGVAADAHNAPFLVNHPGYLTSVQGNLKPDMTTKLYGCRKGAPPLNGNSRD